MSFELLRECVRGVILEKVKKPKEEEAPRAAVTLSSEDILFALHDRPTVSKLNGQPIYTPYVQREAMPERPRGGALAALNPFEVVSTAKYGAKDSKVAPLTLKAEPGAAKLVIEAMADRIARRFEDEGVVAVSCVDSSERMAELLARSVAEKLVVPYQPIVKKTMDPNVSWDEDEWAKFQDRVRTDKVDGNGHALTIKVDGKKRPATPDEYLAATLAVMHKERDQARRTIRDGKQPSLVRMMNMKTGHKSLFNLFDKIDGGDLAAGSKVLVVDDNIDSGWTPYHVAKRMREAGLVPLFAAGFKMTRPKKEKDEPEAPSVTPVLDQAIAAVEPVADEWADDLFQVGSLLMAMDDSEEHGVKASDVFKVLKATPAGVELEDVYTQRSVRLSGPDLAPDARGMWQSAA